MKSLTLESLININIGLGIYVVSSIIAFAYCFDRKKVILVHNYTSWEIYA